tara:strand:- start:98 stop:598 length:501 start_codon:yes stop_codon:yes gene_type:complete
MIRILALTLIPLSFYFSQSSQKIILKNDIQEYLFSVQLIFHDFIRFEDETFNNKENSRISNSLESLTKMLLKSKGDFHRLSLIKYNNQEKKLISIIDDYTNKLKEAINQLKLISKKKNETSLYSSAERLDDKIKLIELKKLFLDERQSLNDLLNEFILTNVPAVAH